MNIKKDIAMTTTHSSYPLNTFPLVSKQAKKPLRLRAWKDETFRQEQIANPKGVIQQVFLQCFPNGKLPEQMTCKVTKEDQSHLPLCRICTTRWVAGFWGSRRATVIWGTKQSQQPESKMHQALPTRRVWHPSKAISCWRKTKLFSVHKWHLVPFSDK